MGESPKSEFSWLLFSVSEGRHVTGVIPPQVTYHIIKVTKQKSLVGTERVFLLKLVV